MNTQKHNNKPMIWSFRRWWCWWFNGHIKAPNKLRGGLYICPLFLEHDKKPFFTFIVTPSKSGGRAMKNSWPDNVTAPQGFDALPEARRSKILAEAQAAYDAALNPNWPNSFSSRSAAAFRAQRILNNAMTKGKRKP